MKQNIFLQSVPRFVPIASSIGPFDVQIGAIFYFAPRTLSPRLKIKYLSRCLKWLSRTVITIHTISHNVFTILPTASDILAAMHMEWPIESKVLSRV